MPSCLPNDLTEAAKGYQGISPTMLEAVKVYLLAQIAGLGSSTPDELAALAKCYACVSPTMLKGMEVALLCTATGGVPVCPPCPDPAPSSCDAFGRMTFGNSNAGPDIVIAAAHCIPGYDLESDPSIITLSFPNLIDVDPTNIQGGAVHISDNPNMVSLSMPMYTWTSPAFQNFYCANNTLLASVDLSSLIPPNLASINFTGCALNQASVDLILSRGVANPAFVSGNVLLNGGTSSPPSSTAPGSDYAILVARGVTVNVNP